MCDKFCKNDFQMLFYYILLEYTINDKNIRILHYKEILFEKFLF